MIRFVKKTFISAIMIFSCNALNVNPLKCVSMNNRECRIRPQIMKFNSNEHLFYH